MTSDEVRAALRAKYPETKGQYVCASEVCEGTGARSGRRADFLVVCCWPSDNYDLIGFEIKVSRPDWLTELRQPNKAEAISRYCTHWYIAAPKGVLVTEELPTGWGYMEIGTHNDARTVVKASRVAHPDHISPGFLASLVRRVSQGGVSREEIYAADQRGYKRAEEFLTEKHKREAGWLTDDVKRLQADLEKVYAFEKETGIPVLREPYYQRNNPDKIPVASAVRWCMDGGMKQEEQRLREICEKLQRAEKSIRTLLETPENATETHS